MNLILPPYRSFYIKSSLKITSVSTLISGITCKLPGLYPICIYPRQVSNQEFLLRILQNSSNYNN